MKRANKGKGAKKGDLSASSICRMLEADQPDTGVLAEHFFQNSKSMREDFGSEACGMAACALLAFKMNEVEAIDPSYVAELEEEV